MWIIDGVPEFKSLKAFIIANLSVKKQNKVFTLQKAKNVGFIFCALIYPLLVSHTHV